MSVFNVQPITLTGRYVRLEPLDEHHAPALLDAAQDSAIWAYMPVPQPTTHNDLLAIIHVARRAAERGAELPFAIVDLRSGAAIGSTRYLDIQPDHRGLEIGWTWLGRAWQGGAVNPECKLLLMRHAFDTLGALRVQLKTDGRNAQSQRAIAKLGAQREGVLRSHRICWDGHVRDTVMFSVLRDEWPRVRAGLEERLVAFHRA